jgi:molecular chaperone GrpE
MTVLMDKDATNRKTAGREGNAHAGQGEASTQLEVSPVAAEMTPTELEDLKARAAKADENWDRFVRLTADFDNYKKRAARERQEAVAFANENLLARLLPVLDAFEMALAAANNDPAAKSLQAGIVMISNQLKSVLAEAGLEKIDASGKPFDPNLHEAVSQEESAHAPEGQVLRQIRNGYKFRNRLLRPAGVVVAKKPAA